jgi:hypothetical protein
MLPMAVGLRLTVPPLLPVGEALSHEALGDCALFSSVEEGMAGVEARAVAVAALPREGLVLPLGVLDRRLLAGAGSPTNATARARTTSTKTSTHICAITIGRAREMSKEDM